MKINTRFGELDYDTQTGRVIWAENKVWENWPTLANEGLLGTYTPDGYLTEVCMSGYPNVTWPNYHYKPDAEKTLADFERDMKQ